MLRNMRILATHDGGGCGFYRIVLPMRQMILGGHSVDIVNQNNGQTAEFLKRANEYDVVVCERLTSYDGVGLWRRSRTPKNRLVYENDDDLFSVELVNNIAYRTYSNPHVQEAVKMYAEAADLLTVTTPHLLNVFAEHARNANGVAIPNFIPEDIIDTVERDWDRPRVGWIGGSSHSLDLHECVVPVRRFMDKNRDWELYIGGTDYRPTFATRDLSQMVYGGWTQITDDSDLFYRSFKFDIGVIPLRDTLFGRSKSAIKALEMNAQGIPVIVSDVEPYRDYIHHGQNGFLVREEHEWLKYLRLLAADADLREYMSAVALNVARQYTIEKNWRLWEDAYEGLF